MRTDMLRLQSTQVATLLLVVFVATSGCLGVLTGSEPLEVESSPAKADDATLQETGYEQSNVTEMAMNQSVTVQNQTREVRLTNWGVFHEKNVDMGLLGEQKAAQFITFSTPSFTILGQSFNPISEMSDEKLLEQVLSKYSGVDDVTQVNSTNIVMLGEGTNVTKFATTANTAGMSVDVYIHLTTVKHEGDYVVALGVYPQQIDEESNVLELMRNVEHTTE